jgi:hypothetical protein
MTYDEFHDELPKLVELYLTSEDNRKIVSAMLDGMSLQLSDRSFQCLSSELLKALVRRMFEENVYLFQAVAVYGSMQRLRKYGISIELRRMKELRNFYEDRYDNVRVRQAYHMQMSILLTHTDYYERTELVIEYYFYHRRRSWHIAFDNPGGEEGEIHCCIKEFAREYTKIYHEHYSLKNWFKYE